MRWMTWRELSARPWSGATVQKALMEEDISTWFPPLVGGGADHIPAHLRLLLSSISPHWLFIVYLYTFPSSLDLTEELCVYMVKSPDKTALNMVLVRSPYYRATFDTGLHW
jgi:hypothetical protein